MLFHPHISFCTYTNPFSWAHFPSLKNPSCQKGKLTNRIHLQFNLRTHNLIPLINPLYQVPRVERFGVVKRAGAAEGMGERGIFCEEFIDCVFLGGGWCLG